MAEPYTCRSPCHNLPPGGEDELVKGLPRAPTKDSNTFTPSLAVSLAQTSALASTLALAPSSTQEQCQQILKTYAATVKLLE